MKASLQLSQAQLAMGGPGAAERRPYGLLAKLGAEFLADLLFVFLGSLCTLKGNNSNVITHAAFAHGFAIFVLSAALGHIR